MTDNPVSACNSRHALALGSAAEPLPHNDQWKTWLAGEERCPRSEDVDASQSVQVQVMLCLVNYARAQEGLQPLALSGQLGVVAAAKAADIVNCRDFNHTACGKPWNEAALQAGYRGSLGENLYAAEGPLVAPRAALNTCLNSPGHRANLFRPSGGRSALRSRRCGSPEHSRRCRVG
jgi:uncharacterized protein YkwD